MDSLEARDILLSAALPEKTDRYTPIAHSVIDVMTRNILYDMGFEIKSTTYNSTNDGQVGQCKYSLNFGDDPDMGLMVAWQNSYNKTISFKYAVGTYVFICDNGAVAGDVGAYKRKHTGTADLEAFTIIRNYLRDAKSIYERLIADKKQLMAISLTPQEMAGYMGLMFIHDEIITSTQLNIMKREYENPTYDYGVPKCNAWSLYNYATYAFKEDSPRTWMKRHIDLHNFFSRHFELKKYPVTPQDAYKQEPLFIIDSEEQKYDVFVHDLDEEMSLDEELDKVAIVSEEIEELKVEEKASTYIDILDDF